jgi:hypothetical protein
MVAGHVDSDVRNVMRDALFVELAILFTSPAITALRSRNGWMAV